MNTLALTVQQGLGRDPHAGEIFCFRGRKDDLVKLLRHDGVGMSLYAKRLEAGKFIWPAGGTGEVVQVSAVQLWGICLTNNAAERALRGIALGRKYWLLAGSVSVRPDSAAFMYSLIVTAKMNDVDPQAWLADVLARLPNTTASRVPELPPWNWQLSERQLAA